MKIEEVIQELIVDDVSKSINFYVSNLGFVLEESVPKGAKPLWAQISKDGKKIMFQDWNETINEIPELKTRIKNGITILVFKLEDESQIIKLSEEINTKISIVIPLRRTEYGTMEFGIYDPDKNILLFSV